jgi:hypothetical protein
LHCWSGAGKTNAADAQAVRKVAKMGAPSRWLGTSGHQCKLPAIHLTVFSSRHLQEAMHSSGSTAGVAHAAVQPAELRRTPNLGGTFWAAPAHPCAIKCDTMQPAEIRRLPKTSGDSFWATPAHPCATKCDTILPVQLRRMSEPVGVHYGQPPRTHVPANATQCCLSSSGACPNQWGFIMGNPRAPMCHQMRHNAACPAQAHVRTSGGSLWATPAHPCATKCDTMLPVQLRRMSEPVGVHCIWATPARPCVTKCDAMQACSLSSSGAHHLGAHSTALIPPCRKPPHYPIPLFFQAPWVRYQFLIFFLFFSGTPGEVQAFSFFSFFSGTLQGTSFFVFSGLRLPPASCFSHLCEAHFCVIIHCFQDSCFYVTNLTGV